MKVRVITAVAASYDLVPQTVGNLGARYRKEHSRQKESGSLQE